MAVQTLIPLRDKISILDKSYQALEGFIKKRLLGFTEYNEDKAEKLKKEIFEKISKQDKINRLWAGLNIPLGYNQAATEAKERLEKIEAKVKKKKFDLVSAQSKKNGTVRLVSYMDAANKKIKETVTQYFNLLKKANQKTAALQNLQLQNLVDSQEILKGTEEIIKASMVPVERITKAGFTYLATPSRIEVSRDIEKLFKKLFGEFDFISITMKNGKTRNYKPTAYIKMLARTEMRTIQTQAVKDRCREYQNDLVTIPPHDDPCPICEPYQGQIFSLSGKHPIYPPAIPMPIHPNCEDHYSPTSEEAIENEKKFGKVFPEPYFASIEDTIEKVKKIKKGEIISAAKSIDEAIANMKKLMPSLSDKEIAAIKDYTFNDYRHINTFLRDGNISLNASETKNMNALFELLKKSPKYEGVVYRGAYFSKPEFQSFMQNIQKGNIVTLKGFTSTTIDKKIVENFMLKFPETTGAENVLFEIQSKNGVFLNGLSRIEKEFEVLFTDKTKFEILDISRITDESKTIIKLKEV